jgi:Fe-S-cluster containining protein
MIEKFECKKCGRCCRNFGGFLPIWGWEADELKKIAKEKNISLELKPAELWADEKTGLVWCFQIRLANEPCPFLLDNQCSIYKNRPLICKSFPLGHSYLIDLGESKNKLSFGNCPNFDAEKFMMGFNSIPESKKIIEDEMFVSSFQLDGIKKFISETMKDLVENKKIKLKRINESDYKKYPNYLSFFEFLTTANFINEEAKKRIIQSFQDEKTARATIKELKKI